MMKTQLPDRHYPLPIIKIELLRERETGVSQWNRERCEGHEVPGLRGVQLGAAMLWAANLCQVDLSYSDLSFAILIEADLRGADMHGANLTGADLRGAYLGGANLTGARITAAQLGGVKDLTQSQVDSAAADSRNPPQLDFLLARFA